MGARYGDAELCFLSIFTLNPEQPGCSYGMNTKTNLRQIPLFLLTIPLVFLINNANYYFKLLDWSLIIAPVIIYFLISLPVYYILARIFKSYNKSAIYTCLLLLIFYFFSALHQWLRESKLVWLSHYSILLSLLLVILILLFFNIKKSNRSFSKFIYQANLISLLLCFAGMLQLAYKYISKFELLNDQADPEKKLSTTYLSCDTCTKPDIYYILLDGYTNSGTLQKEFGYNNSAVENFLTSKGFYIKAGSRSNYNFTHMSMASEFNLNYLSHLDNSNTFYTKEFLQSYYTMYKNEWCRILLKEGYGIRNYSIFNIEGAPVQVTPFLTELSFRSIPGQTFFNKLNRDIGWKLNKLLYSTDQISKEEKKYIDKNIKRIEETFDGVLQETRLTNSSPRFVYAHFLLPHETFYYDSTGQRLPDVYTIKTPLNKKDYVNQLAYTNKYIIEPLVDSIVKNNHRPVIIIIQGDHGYRNYPPEQIDLEFGNFNAVLFPEKNYTDFNTTHSSVNTFRIVLNNYFGQHLPLLKDSSINLMKKRSQ